MSDMRLIDSRVSTTWCQVCCMHSMFLIIRLDLLFPLLQCSQYLLQRQIVRANTTFNAFLMADSPHVTKTRTPVSMTRHLLLSDDMKEYWGFYLLKGSTVTVSTCAR